LSETLDKLINFAKGDRRDLASNDKIEFLAKFSEIFYRLRRLLIKFKRDFVSNSTIFALLRLRQTLQRLTNLMGVFLKTSNTF